MIPMMKIVILVNQVTQKRQASPIWIHQTLTFLGKMELPVEEVECQRQMVSRIVTQNQVIQDQNQDVHLSENFWLRDVPKVAFWRIVEAVQLAIAHVLVCTKN